MLSGIGALEEDVVALCVGAGAAVPAASIFHASSELKYLVSFCGLTHSRPRKLKNTFISAPSLNGSKSEQRSWVS